MALQLVPKRRALPNPSLVHLFSTAADPDDRNDRSRSSFSSYFSDVKSTLRQEQSSSSSSSSSPPIHRLRRSPPSSPSGFQPPPVKSLLEVRQSLSAFRRPVADSSPPPDDSAQPSPFRSLFNRTAAENGDATAGRLSWGSIRESLGSMKQQSVASEKQSSPLSALRQSLRMPQPDGYSPPLSRTSEDLPSSVFGREMREKEDGRGGGLGASVAMKTDFVKGYGYEELGDKLKKLRPEGKKEEGGWFSIEELNGRLEKLRDSELKETDSLFGGSYKHVRHSLINLAEDSKSKRNAMESFDILGQLGRTPSYMKLPPKEHLLETYNHPDNMSAAEKMKIELAKVREEFKMSESDCGSTRVQVALLTTKIKYLSSVLHKKDKHSRKGLVEMVHKRKRLLKYLRRTDWDSYCFVLDKLGLRDTPEYKTYDYKR